jgi:hypothetical protein
MDFALSLDRGTPTIIKGLDLATVTAEQIALNPEVKNVSVKKLITLENGVRMIVPNYISNSAFQKFYKDPEDYVTNYCLFNPPSRFAQTIPMMYGSAFDGYIKHHLYTHLYPDMIPEFDMPNIIHDQCERQFWDEDYCEVINGVEVKYDPEFNAFKWGKHLFDQYKASGSYLDLLKTVRHASELPRFEFTVTSSFVEGALGSDGKVDFVLLGKPDLYFLSKDGAHIILDFKCNSIGGKKTSPKKGYIVLKDGWETGQKHSPRHNKPHKDASILSEGGIDCNFAHRFEDIERSWADQTTCYSWLMGTPVGGKVIAGIDQLIGQGNEGYELPNISVAQHRYVVQPDYQLELYEAYKKMWVCLNNGHIFHELSKVESNHKIASIHALFGTKHETGSDIEWLANNLRKQNYFG